MKRSGAHAMPGIGAPAGISLTLHALILAFVFTWRSPAPEIRAPIYSVNLIAALAGQRAVGVVRPARSSTDPASPVPVRARTSPRDMPSPEQARRAERVTSEPATPVPTPTDVRQTPQQAAPTAGGGPTGGRGADVATVRTEGIEFPYPVYLENIVRQIALRFQPPRSGALRAEMVFLIRRDGSVSSVRFLKRSGNFAFDLEAQGAVEASGNARAFGPLPDGFHDDVLPVIFSFDPRVLR